MSKFIEEKKIGTISFAEFDVTVLGEEVYDAILEVGKDQRKEMRTSPLMPESNSKTSGTYKNSIDLKQDRQKKTIYIYENRKRKNNKRIIGHLLENGTVKMPPQPHWKTFEKEYNPKYEDAAIDAINGLT